MGERLDTFYLSPSERRSFLDDGYIGPFPLFSREETAELRAAIGLAKGISVSTVYPGIRTLIDRHLDTPPLTDLIFRREIVQRLQGAIDPNLLIWRSSFFPKPPGAEGTDWHQTQTFTEFEGARKLVHIDLGPRDYENPRHPPYECTVWLALTEASSVNGCLRIIPGTHDKLNYDDSKKVEFTASENLAMGGFYGYNYKVLQIDPEWVPDESKAIDLEMRAGEFVVFTSRALHASHPNRSPWPRLGYAMRFCSANVKVYPDMSSFKLGDQTFPLDHYGCVLVGGVDPHRHNRMRSFEGRPPLPTPPAERDQVALIPR
jgi:non-heme Fe2+,alpha-ketoglutarate-dependent halogenase